MTEMSKWFVFKKDDEVFGCFRIKPITNKKFDQAYKLLMTKLSIFEMNDIQKAKEFAKIIAKHLIQDWENVEITQAGQSSIKETRYSPEAAYQLMVFGDLGAEISTWVLEKSKSIS